jgi:hypothetical protein
MYSTIRVNFFLIHLPETSTNTKTQETGLCPCFMNIARHLLHILNRNQCHLWFIFSTSEVCFFLKKKKHSDDANHNVTGVERPKDDVSAMY